MNVRYVLLFIAIQIASAILFLLGLPVCAYLAYGHKATWDGKQWHWPAWAFIWDNKEDGVTATWYSERHANWTLSHREFMWTALRNSVNNLRFVPGVSAQGRPLWYRTWMMRGKRYYVKWGWLSDGYICSSAGSGRGY